jgi:hypothetical protein
VLAGQPHQQPDEQRDQRQRDGGLPADPLGHALGDRREDPHAQHRQGGEQPGGRRAQAEVGTDRLHQRRHGGKRRPQVQRDQEDCEDEQPAADGGPHCGATGGKGRHDLAMVAGE